MSKNINPREKAEKKQKIKNIIFKVIHGISYVCTGLFVAVCIFSCATSQRKQANAEVYPSEIQYRIDDLSESESSSEISYPIYDDVSYTITLNNTQLNNYTWDNFLQYLSTLQESTLDDISIIYKESTYLYEESQISEELYFRITYLFNGYYITLNYLYNNNQFEYVDAGDDTQYVFEEDVEIILDVNTYTNVKNAIQLDIQANEPSGDIDVSIFDGITQSLTGFIATLNSGLTAIIGLFWNSTTSNLTPLGILTTLVVGFVLAYFVFRLISGLIRLRG